MRRRVLIYGVTGSGKSTFATNLGRQSGLPVHLVDEICWLPDWVPMPDEVQADRISEIVAGEEWILDSAYGKWIDRVLPRAELVVGLDYPRHVSLRRLLVRTISRALTREKVCNGNTESLRLAMSRDSIILWHFKSFARKRSRMRSWAVGGLPHAKVVLVKTPRQAEALLAEGGLLNS